VIASTLALAGVGHKLPLIVVSDETEPDLLPFLLANLTSHVLDYVARQKVGGTSLTYFYLRQFPVLPPSSYDNPAPWSPDQSIRQWLLPRALELVFTSSDLAPLARQCGYQGPPFRWKEERRFLLRGEVDAAFFHLYGVSRAEVEYIVDTFPIIRAREEARHGEYRTKRLILERYQAMQDAATSGGAYVCPLNPPPGDPRASDPSLQSMTSP
jgi:hypothetical protein